MRACAVIGLVLLLSACGDLGQTQPTIFSAELPGLSDFDNITKGEKAEAAWWDKFYGRSSSSDGSGTSKSGGTQIGGGQLGSTGGSDDSE